MEPEQIKSYEILTSCSIAWERAPPPVDGGGDMFPDQFDDDPGLQIQTILGGKREKILVGEGT